MSKYIVKPAGSMKELAESGIAKLYREDANGRRVEQGDYQNALLPKGALTHRVHYDEKNRQYDINIPKDMLQNIVSRLHYIDPDTNKAIESADPKNQYDPFFKLQDLSITIPNSGVLLDDEDPLGLFWLYAFKSEPLLFNIDNSEENPLIKKQQVAKVTTAGHNEKEFSQDVLEGKRAQGILFSIKDDFNEMVETCRAMDIVIGEDPDMDMMHTALYIKITTEKDFKARDGQRNIEKFLGIKDMSREEKHLRAKITEAIGYGIISKEGSNLVFNDIIIGNNSDKAYHFLTRSHNSDIKGDLLARIAERTNAGKEVKKEAVPAGEDDDGFNF